MDYQSKLAPFPSADAVSRALAGCLSAAPISDCRWHATSELSRALPRAFGYYGASVTMQVPTRADLVR